MNNVISGKKLKAENVIFPALLLIIRTFFLINFVSANEEFGLPITLLCILITAVMAALYSLAMNLSCSLSTRFGIFVFAMLAADPLLFIRVVNVWSISEIGLFAIEICIIFSKLKAKPVLVSAASILLVLVSPRAFFSFIPVVILLTAAEFFADENRTAKLPALPICALAGGAAALVVDEIARRSSSFLALCSRTLYTLFPVSLIFDFDFNIINLIKGIIVSLPVIIFSVIFVAEVIGKKGGRAFAVAVIIAYVLSFAGFFMRCDYADLAAMNCSPLFIILLGLKNKVPAVSEFAQKAEKTIKAHPVIAFIAVIWLGACAFSFTPYGKYYEYSTRYTY